MPISRSMWRDDFTPKEIKYVFSELNKVRSVSPEGTISYTSGNDYEGLISCLVSFFDLDTPTNALRRAIVRDALSSPELPDDFTEQDFRKVAHRLRAQYTRQNRGEYRVVFPIWNRPSFLPKLMRRNGAVINFHPAQTTRLYKRILKVRSAQSSEQFYLHHFLKEYCSDLSLCDISITSLSAHDPYDAFEKASLAMYEILGLLNLARDGEKFSRDSYSTKGNYPVSDVLIGPQVTVHNTDGVLAWNGFWHSPWNGGARPMSFTPNYEASWSKQFKTLDEGVKRSLWRNECKNALVNYFDAFSNPNLRECFLEGWRLFEVISGSQDEKTEKKIVRASHMFVEDVEYRVIGKHLRIRRNGIVHGNPIEVYDDESLAFQLLRFVVPYLRFYILNGFNLRSVAELYEFLDLPPSRDLRQKKAICIDRKLRALDRKRYLLLSAAKFRKEATE